MSTAPRHPSQPTSAWESARSSRRPRSRGQILHQPGGRPPLPARARVALTAGRVGSALSRRLGKGSGGVIGGNVALRLYPSALQVLAAGRDVALVSGTNGKSTTTELLAKALGQLGAVAHNRSGSNMANGLVVALDAARDARLAALEVDEAYLGPIIRATRPRTVTLINLNREFTPGVSYKREAQHWRETLPAVDRDCTIVANADDPLVVWSVRGARHGVVRGASHRVFAGELRGLEELRPKGRPGPVWPGDRAGRRRRAGARRALAVAAHRPPRVPKVDPEGASAALVHRLPEDDFDTPVRLEGDGTFAISAQ